MAKSDFKAGMRKRTAAKNPPKATTTAKPAKEDKPEPKQPPHRAGKAPIIAYVPKPFLKQLKMHCVENETNQQQVIIDALNEYFESRQKAGIA